MPIYKNLTGRSGVREFEFDPDGIWIEFNDGAMYLYNYDSCGRYNVNQMKNLAKKGVGLNRYINANAYYDYAYKEDHLGRSDGELEKHRAVIKAKKSAPVRPLPKTVVAPKKVAPAPAKKTPAAPPKKIRAAFKKGVR